MPITLEEIKEASKVILDDKSWVNDSHSQREWMGMYNALETLMNNLKETK